MSDDFNNRNLPEIICVCTPERKENYTYFEGGSLVNNEGIRLLSFDEIKDMGLQVPNDTKMGSLLMRYPFSQSRYINVEDVGNHRSDKFYKYREILSKLGAKKFSVVEATKSEYKMHFNEKGKLNIKGVKGKENLDIHNTVKKELGFNLESTSEGKRTISVEAYEDALKLVHEYNLSEDEYLMSLIKTRNPKNENHDGTFYVQIRMMDELNKKIEIAAAFQTVGELFNISAQVQNAISHKTEYYITVNVEFPV